MRSWPQPCNVSCRRINNHPLACDYLCAIRQTKSCLREDGTINYQRSHFEHDNVIATEFWRRQPMTVDLELGKNHMLVEAKHCLYRSSNGIENCSPFPNVAKEFIWYWIYARSCRYGTIEGHSHVWSATTMMKMMATFELCNSAKILTSDAKVRRTQHIELLPSSMLAQTRTLFPSSYHYSSQTIFASSPIITCTLDDMLMYSIQINYE